MSIFNILGVIGNDSLKGDSGSCLEIGLMLDLISLGDFRLKLNLERLVFECLVELTFFCVKRVFSVGEIVRVNV